MKIMGNNGANYNSDKIYFLSASRDELINLMGYQYAESKMEELFNKAGSNIPISKMFEKLYRLANKEKELIEISAKLKAAADFINSALPTIQVINEKKKDDQVEG
jgi:hypothetical protein